MISYKNGYLMISSEIVVRYFGHVENIYYVFDPKTKEIMIASVTNDIFRQSYRCESTFLKSKDSKGTKCIQINNIILDNGLDEQDRVLEFYEDIEGQILKIKV